MGVELGEGGTGGGSDGNFTAAIGVPTLDGLGAEGEGAHAAHEHVLTGSLPRRPALVAGLLAESEVTSGAWGLPGGCLGRRSSAARTRVWSPAPAPIWTTLPCL